MANPVVENSLQRSFSSHYKHEKSYVVPLTAANTPHSKIPISNTSSKSGFYQTVFVPSVSRAGYRFLLEFPEQLVNSAQRGESLSKFEFYQNYTKSLRQQGFTTSLLIPGFWGAVAKGAQSVVKLEAMKQSESILPKASTSLGVLSNLFAINVMTASVEAGAKFLFEQIRYQYVAKSKGLDSVPITFKSASTALKQTALTVLPFNVVYTGGKKLDYAVREKYPSAHSPIISSGIIGFGAAAFSNFYQAALTQGQLGNVNEITKSGFLTRMLGRGWAMRGVVVGIPASAMYYSQNYQSKK